MKYNNINNEVLIFKNINIPQSKREWKLRRKIISRRAPNNNNRKNYRKLSGWHDRFPK
jgi:hypothetical protein